MKWALIAGGAIVTLIAVVAVIGALLPRDHIATLSARIAATPDAVWDVITDVAGHPSWRSDVQRIEVLPSTATGASWREHSKNGALTMAVDHADAPRRLVTRIADKDLPFGGQWEYVIEPDGSNASRLTITERGSVYNPVFRFVSRFIMGHTATIDTYLRALGRKFGDEPTPVVVASTH
jgi:uncharacterized protein YndB with AHSA1/START domain